MQNKFTGLIEDVEIQETVSYGSENLGPCWLSQNNGAGKREWITNFIQGDKRNIIVASEEKELLDHLIKMVDEAKEIVCISTFLIQKSGLTDALLKAAERDVRVYLLTAQKEDLITASDELSEWETMLIEEHKDILDSFAGNVLVRTALHFHAKFILIDPKSQSTQGLVMTCNATVNAMCGKNMEIAATLTPSEITSYFSQFIRGFWEEANHELLKKGELAAVKDVDFKMNLGEITHPATCSDEYSLKDAIVKIIDNAHKKLVITGWSFDKDHEVVRALFSALQRGVKVNIYTKPNYRNTEALIDLLKNGAKIVGHERYHAKLILSDGSNGLVTTSNYTKKGLDEGFEVSVTLGANEIGLVQDVIDHWNEKCDWMLASEVKDAPTKVRQYNSGMRDMNEFEIQDSFSEEEPRYAPDSIDQMLDHTIDTSKYNRPKNTDKILYKSVVIHKKMIPPKLPENAKLLSDIKGPYPIYSSGKNGKGRSVLVTNWEDVEKAKPFALEHNARIVVNAPQS